MKELFSYLKRSNELPLIKSCVFHYEMEFIHPFPDGNSRMGRLWQSVLLKQYSPVFEYLPFETLISRNQKNYYRALSVCDKQGASTVFIIFMLKILSQSLDELLEHRSGPILNTDRIHSFLASGIKEFTRKDYMKHFKTISSATASRDIKLAVAKKLVKKPVTKTKRLIK